MDARQKELSLTQEVHSLWSTASSYHVQLTLKKTVTMRNTTGTQSYPTAVVVIELDGHRYEREVAVSEQLQEDTLLGVDVPLWPHLVKAVDTNELAQIKSLIEQEETSYAVTTRAQARRSDLQRELEQNLESVVEPDAIDTEGSTTETNVSPASNQLQPSNSEQVCPRLQL